MTATNQGIGVLGKFTRTSAILNFGADDCIPGIPNSNWWYILNSLSVTRLDNGEEIEVYDRNYSTDRSGWC